MAISFSERVVGAAANWKMALDPASVAAVGSALRAKREQSRLELSACAHLGLSVFNQRDMHEAFAAELEPQRILSPGKVTHLSCHTAHPAHHLHSFVLNSTGLVCAKSQSPYYCVGSVGKLISGLVIRDVLRQHELTLESTLGEIFLGDDAFFTQFFAPKDREMAKRVSMKALGMHTSGIIAGKMPTGKKARCTSPSITEDCRNIGFQFTFMTDPADGIRFYSNIAVALLGMVVEKLEQRSFRDVMTERFQRNGLEGVRMRGAEARNDVAFGVEATAEGLEMLLQKIALEGKELKGFDTSGLEDVAAQARANQSRLLWLMETPCDGVWGHGGVLGDVRTHFYWHARSGTGFSAVGNNRGFTVILNVVEKMFCWKPYEKFTPKVWQEKGEALLPANIVFWAPGRKDVVKGGEEWTQAGRVVTSLKKRILQTISTRSFLLRYRGGVFAPRR